MARTTAQRGYGGAHQKLRKQWAKIIARGGGVCARCGRAIVPGMLWDLGHHDTDRSVYTGPEHRYCNRAAAAQKVNRIKRAKTRRSRVW